MRLPRLRSRAALLRLGWILASSAVLAAAPPSETELWERIRRAEDVELNGATASAVELYRLALDTLAGFGPEERAALVPEAELLLRRLYGLAGEPGVYGQLLPLLERWSAEGPDAPAAGEPSVAALARFYAGAAAAYSRPDLSAARSLWRPLGFLEKWWVIGPFDNERGGGFATPYGPERDPRPDAGREHSGKMRPVAWRPLPVEPVTGWVDFDALMRPNEQALAYAMTFVHAERELDAVLRLGSDEGFRLWVNGRLVAQRNLERAMRFDQDAIAVRLHEGWNSFLVKVAEEKGRWEFRARLCRPDGGTLGAWVESLPPADATLPPPASEVDAPPEPPALPAAAGGALARLDERLRAEPERAELHYLRGALLQARRAHGALEHPDREALQTAVRLHAEPAPAMYYVLLAQSLRREIGIAADRDYNAWRRALERALEADPPAAVALVELANYYLDTFDNLERARELAARARELSPESFEARLLLGKVGDRQGFPRAVERAHEEFLEAGLRDDPRVLRHEAIRLRDRGRRAQAYERLEERLRGNQLDEATRRLLVSFHLDEGNAGKARELLAGRLVHFPFDAAPRREIVEIHRGHGELEAALAAQRELVALAPDDHEYRKVEGDLLWQLGEQEAAFEAWEAALALQPNYPPLREYLDFLRSRRDVLVETFERDVSELIETVRTEPLAKDDEGDPFETVLDLTAVAVHVDGTSKEYHQEVLRILNDQGVRTFDRYRSYYAAGDERLEFKKARVVHADGSEDRARLRVYEGGEPGSGQYRSAAVDLPPLRPGDVVEVQYVREELHQSFFGDYFGRREVFQGSAPMREKTFVLRLPAEKRYHFHYRNLEARPTIDDDPAAGSRTYTWSVRDVAKLKPEPGMPSLNEHAPCLEVSTFASWEAMASWYWNLIRNQLESSPEIAGKVAELTSGKTSPRDRIRALYNFIVQDVRYNAWEFGVHGFKPYNAPTIFARRFGDCKDKATLLSVMLEEIGIPAYPVLIYATHERWAEDLSLPMINHFNHCITYLPAGEGYDEMFLDGTAQHNRLEELPGSDRGARVLVVRPGGGSLETIPWNSAEDIALQQDVQVDVHADGSATLEIRGRAVGDYGAAVRSHFEVPGKRQRDLERLFARSYPGVEVESESFSDLSQLVEPVSFHLRLRVPDLVHPAAEGLSMKAVDDLFETTRILEGKAALEERRHDVVLGAPRSSVLQVVVHLPEGLRVKSLPDNRTFENRFGVLEVRYETKEDRVEFSRRLALTAPRVDESDYAQFRELATALDRLTREKWILERTPE